VAVHELAGPAPVGGDYGGPTGQCFQHREAERLSGADRQRDVGRGDRTVQLGPAIDEAAEVHRSVAGEDAQLVEVRTVAVDVEPHRHPAPVQLHRGRHGQVRRLLPREAPDVGQSEHVSTGGSLVRVEGRQVDAERDPCHGAARGVRDGAELALGVARRHDDRVEGTHQHPVEQLDGRLGADVQAGTQRQHVVQTLVRDQHAAHVAASGPARDREQGELVAELDRGRAPLLEHVDHAPRLDDQAVAAADARRPHLDDVAVLAARDGIDRSWNDQ